MDSLKWKCHQICMNLFRFGALFPTLSPDSLQPFSCCVPFYRITLLHQKQHDNNEQEDNHDGGNDEQENEMYCHFASPIDSYWLAAIYLFSLHHLPFLCYCSSSFVRHFHLITDSIKFTQFHQFNFPTAKCKTHFKFCVRQKCLIKITAQNIGWRIAFGMKTFPIARVRSVCLCALPRNWSICWQHWTRIEKLFCIDKQREDRTPCHR